jgi:RNA polymerase sigma factor (sigma-70 family)
MSTESFRKLLDQLKDGKRDDAAAAIVEKFTPGLTAFVAVRMSECLKRRIGAEDVLQSVFATFFRRNDAGRFELYDWGSIFGLLAIISMRRILKYVDHHQAACRDMRRDVMLDVALQAFIREPGPREIAVADETLGQLMDALSEQCQEILARQLLGKSQSEIANEVGVSLSTVGREVGYIRETLLKKLIEEEESFGSTDLGG